MQPLVEYCAVLLPKRCFWAGTLSHHGANIWPYQGMDHSVVLAQEDRWYSSMTGTLGAVAKSETDRRPPMQTQNQILEARAILDDILNDEKNPLHDPRHSMHAQVS